MTKKQSDETQIAVIAEKINNIEKNVQDIKSKLEHEYVTRSEFSPIRNGYYGFITLLVTIVVGAVIMLVIKK